LREGIVMGMTKENFIIGLIFVALLVLRLIALDIMYYT